MSKLPQLSKLAQQYIFPPFSVFDARSGHWQARKRVWLSLGIQSELGRDEGITYGDSAIMKHDTLNYYREQKKGSFQIDSGISENGIDQRHGKRGDNQRKGTDDFAQKMNRCNPAVNKKKGSINNYSWLTSKGKLPASNTAMVSSGMSIFDPVLAELAYSWWCPAGGKILDPFAGGSVRGIVAAVLGYDYTGIELRLEQVEANRQQAIDILRNDVNHPTWVCGDSSLLNDLLDPATSFDFIFSCPPYGDLEVYSDDADDISNMSFGKFLTIYRDIIRKSMTKLKNNSFACFVVGDFRDSKGCYRNFPSRTISAFKEADAYLYNDAILLTAVASLPIRVKTMFLGGRKLGKTHQNVLVFVKGDPMKAAKKCSGNVIDRDKIRNFVKHFKGRSNE